MTLIVFLGVVVSLLILRLIPGLLLRLVLAVPRQHVAATMRWVRGLRIGVVSPRQSANVLTDAITSRRARAAGRLKLVLVSSSLLILAVLATTAFYTWHSTALMILLR